VIVYSSIDRYISLKIFPALMTV